MIASLCLLTLLAGFQAEAAEPVARKLKRGDDPVLLEEVGRIGGRVELVRSQRFVRPPFAARVPDELRSAAVEIRVYGLLSRQRLAARGRAWADLGLGTVDAPRNLLVALAADLEGIGFDPAGNRLLVAPSRLSTEDFEPTEGENDAATLLLLTGMRPDAPIVAHLLMHVRQHERAGGEVLEPTTDGLLAAAAWSEGEANLVAVRYIFAGLQVEEAVMQFVGGPELLMDGALLAAGVSASSGLQQELLSFVYHDGYRLAADLHRQGGWQALDRAMATRRTTRDLLHPERPPLTVAEFRTPAPPREGLKLVDEDSLGERGTVALISLLTGKDSLGLMAGDGWAGDRLYRWEAPGGEERGLTEWVTRWTEAGTGSAGSPAADFDYALARALELRHPGAAFSEVEAGVRTLVAGGKLYRIERRQAEVRLRIQPLAGG